MRVVVRLQKHERQHGWTCPQPSPPPLCVDFRGAGKTSALVFDDEDEDEAHPQLSQPSARASERRQACDMDGNFTSVFSALVGKLLLPPSVSQLKPSFFAPPMERFFTRPAGPPTTAWPQWHDEEEDFLALVLHNAAAQLEMERWPPALKKRRVGKSIVDEQYTQALCNWVAALEAPPEDLPQAKRPGWWRHGMSLSVKGVHRQMAPRLSQQWSLRSRSGHTTSHHEIYGFG